MLTAKFSIESEFGLYNEPAPYPGGPAKAIRIDVTFTNPFSLAWGWLLIHVVDSERKGRLWSVVKLFGTFVVLAGITAFLVYAQLHQRNVVASIPSSELTVTQGPSEKAKRRLHGMSGWSAVLSSQEIGDVAFWVRTGGIALVVMLLLMAVLGPLVNDRFLCRIYLIVLRPHEPFPVIDRRLRSHDVYVYAVRALGIDARQRFFKLWDDNALKQRSMATNSLQVTHEHCKKIKRSDARIDVLSYWALIRFAISRMLPHRESGTIQAMRITQKQHSGLFLVYLVLVGMSITLPAIGWIGSAEASQFPLVMAGLGIGWAFVAVFSHRSKSIHLGEWERRTLDYPFRGCPIFSYSNEYSTGGEWQLVEKDVFQTRIRNFGMDYATLQQFVLGIMLVLYFTVLALAK